MSLESIADHVLDAVAVIAPETRWEEKPDPKTGIEGTNRALRQALGAVEVLYPGSGDECDLGFEFDGHGVRIESKHSWTWKYYTSPGVRNGDYKDHLLGEGENTALHDAGTKLPRLIGQPGVEVIGFLLIALGSTSLRHPAADIDTLARLTGMSANPWKAFSRPERSSSVVGYEPILIKPYLWLRSARR